MRKIILKIILLLSLTFFFTGNIIQNTYAEWWLKVIVSEKIYWANCHTIDKEWNIWIADIGTMQMWECTVEKWFGSVINMMWYMIKWFTFIAALSWVLFVIINGILYSMSWLDPSMKDKAKERIKTTLSWLILLFLSWIVLNMVAPWIYY